MINSIYAGYNYYQKRNDLLKARREGFGFSTAHAAGASSEAKSALMVFLLLLAVDIALFVWAIILAAKCSRKAGNMAILHFLAAAFFPIFYILYAYASGCYKK